MGRLADDSSSAADPTIPDRASVGAGQRLFFLHDGLPPDLWKAIQAHASGPEQKLPASEAMGQSPHGFERLNDKQQDLLNFLRSL